MIDTSQIDNIEIEGVDMSDYPKFCDAYILSCDINGIEATESELDKINEDYEFVYDEVMKSIF